MDRVPGLVSGDTWISVRSSDAILRLLRDASLRRDAAKWTSSVFTICTMMIRLAAHLPTFLAGTAGEDGTGGWPAFVRREFEAYLKCGILAHG